jgi:mono/diheme cytochrome c family protein
MSVLLDDNHAQRTIQHRWGLAIAAATSLLGAAALAAGLTTKDGAFTADQAARGKLVYEQSCVNCHQPDFYVERLARYENKTIDELFQTVSTTMPADNVGGLATSQYVDVLAYFLSVTGSPAGPNELTTDTMENIKIVSAK